MPTGAYFKDLKHTRRNADYSRVLKNTLLITRTHAHTNTLRIACKHTHIRTLTHSALSSLKKVVITESARNKDNYLIPHTHTLNRLLSAPDGSPNAPDVQVDIEETVRTGAIGEDATGSAETRSPSQRTLASFPEDSNTPTLTHRGPSLPFQKIPIHPLSLTGGPRFPSRRFQYTHSHSQGALASLPEDSNTPTLTHRGPSLPFRKILIHPLSLTGGPRFPSRRF